MYCIIKTQSIILAVGCSNTFWQFAAAQLARRGSGSWLLLHNNGLEEILAVVCCNTLFWLLAAKQRARRGSGSWLLQHVLAVCCCTTGSMRFW